MAYDLYVITDPAIARGMPHGGIAHRVVEGGADAVQLRDAHSCPPLTANVSHEPGPLW